MKNFIRQLILVIACGLLVTGSVWAATVLFPTQGGTGLSSYTTGDLIYSDATNSLTVLNVGANTEVLTLAGGVPTWAASAAAGANTALSNLASVAINTSLISDADSTDDLGSATYYWDDAYIDKIFLNATATLSGATAGEIHIVGIVGIGTTDPRAGLEISGVANALYLVAGTNTRMIVGDTTGGSDYGELRWDTTGNYLGLDADLAQALVLQEDGGNVGISVTDPDTKLEIFNAGNQLKLSFDGTDNTIFAVDTSGNLTITPSGTGVSIAGTLGITGNTIADANLSVGNAGTTAGVLTLLEDDDDGSNFASFMVPALAANTVYTLPPDDGDNTEVLQTDGSGVLTWAAAGSGDVLSVGDCTAGACLDGTSDGGTNFAIYDGDSNKTTISMADAAGDLTFILPADDGDAGEQLQTAGNGTLSWEAAGGSAETLAATLAAGADANDVEITSVGSIHFTDENESPGTAGELKYDNTVAGFSDGLMMWYDDDEIRYLVDLDTLPGDGDNGEVLRFSSANDNFYLSHLSIANLVDATSYVNLDFDDTETFTLITSQNTSDHFVNFHNTLADVGNEVTLLLLTYDDDADADADFIKCQDDKDGAPSTVFRVDYDGGVVSLGTIEGATLTEGGNAVYSSGETPSGELGGTYANITIDDSVSVASWTIDSPTFTTGITATDLIDSAHYAAGSIDYEHLADDVISGAAAVGTFESSDTFLCLEAGVGLRECDYDDLPGGGMTSFIAEDGDGTEVSISDAEEWKFVEGAGIDINWTDTTPGSDADPFDLTFAIKATYIDGLAADTLADADELIFYDDTGSDANKITWINLLTTIHNTFDASSELYGITDDETGAGGGTPLLVFNYNPTLTGALFAGIIADNDDMVFEVDANSDGSNSFSFTDGGSTEVMNLDESGNLQFDGTLTVGAVQWDNGSSLIDGEQIAADTIDNDSIDWGDMTDLTTDGAVSWGNIAAGELANDTVNNEDINWGDIDYLDDEGAVDIAAYAAVGTFESGDTFLVLEAGVGIREADFDDLPGVGDVTAVGNCAAGLCLDGTSDGGTDITFYNIDSNKTQLIASDTASDLVMTLPAVTGILLADTTIDASSELLAIMDDETGTGVLTFATAPTFTTSITVPLILTGDVALTIGDAATDSITFVSDGTGNAEFTFPADVIGDADIDWGTGAGQVSAADISFAAGDITNDTIIDADIDDDGNFTFTGTWDFTGGDIVLPTLSVDAGTYAADSIDHADILDTDQMDTKCIWFEDPVATDDFNSIWANKTANAFDITEIWAESDQTVTFMLQVDDGAPADCDSVDLAPAAGEAEDTSLDGDCQVAAGEELDLAVTSVSGTPTWVSICWTGNWVD